MTYIAAGDGPDIKPGEECQHVPPTVVVFWGTPHVAFLAVCPECSAIPRHFPTEADRDRWAEGHRTTGHTVNEAVEVRP